MSALTKWGSLHWTDNPDGASSTAFHGSTPTIDDVEVTVVRLAPSGSWSTDADGPEQLLVVKSGELDVDIAGSSHRAVARTLVFLAHDDSREVKNAGATDAVFHVIAFRTPETGHPTAAKLPSQVLHWDDMQPEPQPTTPEDPVPWYRDRRLFIPASATATSPRLYAHATTIDPGSASSFHPTHRWACFYVGVSGTLRFTEGDGSVYDVGTGDFFYMEEEAAHDQVPIGDEVTSYFVMQVSTSATPS